MTKLSIIPDNKTCLDCIHFNQTCSWLLSRKGTEKDCDWYPNKFSPIADGDSRQHE